MEDTQFWKKKSWFRDWELVVNDQGFVARHLRVRPAFLANIRDHSVRWQIAHRDLPERVSFTTQESDEPKIMMLKLVSRKKRRNDDHNFINDPPEIIAARKKMVNHPKNFRDDPGKIINDRQKFIDNRHKTRVAREKIIDDRVKMRITRGKSLGNRYFAIANCYRIYKPCFVSTDGSTAEVCFVTSQTELIEQKFNFRKKNSSGRRHAGGRYGFGSTAVEPPGVSEIRAPAFFQIKIAGIGFNLNRSDFTFYS